MKQLVVSVVDGVDYPLYIAPSLDDAIRYIKDHFSSYVANRSYRIYTLDSFVSVKYLDNKIFID